MFNKLYKDLLKKVEEGNQCVMLTSLNAQDDTSGEIKEKIILTRDDANNKTFSLDEKIYQGIHKSFVGEEIITVHLDNNEIVLIEPYFPKPRLLIFGGGHIAKPLSEFAHRVGFSVTVVDDFGTITGGTSGKQVYAILIDPRGVKLHEGYNASRYKENADGDFVNYVRHFEDTGFISKYSYMKVYETA